MKIVHFCLSSFYVDGCLYQENQLVKIHADLGHEVLVIASTETYDQNGITTYVQPAEYVDAEGFRIIRIAYRRFLPSRWARKIRAHPGVRRLLEDFRPDAIVFHGCAGWELLTVSKYAEKHPSVVFHIDSHADEMNSGRSYLSKHLLHGFFYRWILNRALATTTSLLCVSVSCMRFAESVYGVGRNRIEFFPLGGQILDAETYAQLRQSGRAKMGIDDETIVIVQTGKINRAKKLIQSLRAFSMTSGSRLRLVVAGILQDDIRRECEALIAADPRVDFIGWKDKTGLTELLCSADVYLQPGTQSATMQHSLCCGCAVILDQNSSHEPYVQGNGWLISSEQELFDVVSKIEDADLEAMKARSMEIAKNMLDYAKMAKKLLEQ